MIDNKELYVTKKISHNEIAGEVVSYYAYRDPEMSDVVIDNLFGLDNFRHSIALGIHEYGAVNLVYEFDCPSGYEPLTLKERKFLELALS